MARWQGGTLDRLERAALDLFLEHGFEQTTVVEIAERAGLTERTFFRYFKDKREVLFWGAERLQGVVEASAKAAPRGHEPMSVVLAALRAAAAELFEPRREFIQRRQQVIAANGALRERELLKLEEVRHALHRAVEQRGNTAEHAAAAADVGVLVLRSAVEEWAGSARGPELSRVLDTKYEVLRAVIN